MHLSKSILQWLFHLSLLLCTLNLAHAGEPPTEPILRIELGKHVDTITSIATDKAGRWLLTASQDKSARIWDLRDGHLLSTFRTPIGDGDEGKLRAAALSPNGEIVALGGYTTAGESGVSIYLFDRDSGNLLRRINGLLDTIEDINFSPDGLIIATTLNEKMGLRLFSVADGRLLAEDRAYGDASYSVQFSRDGKKLVTTSADGYLRLYRWNGHTLSLLNKRNAPGGKDPYSVAFSPDDRLIAVGFNDTSNVNVLSATDLSFVYAADTAGVDGGLSAVAWAEKGGVLYAAGSSDKEFDGYWHQYIRRWQDSRTEDYMAANGGITRLLALPDGRLAFGTSEPAWGVIDEQGILLLRIGSGIADFRDNLNGFTLSPNGSQVRFSYQVNGQSPAVFDSQQHTFVTEQNLIEPLLTSPSLNVTDWKTTPTPKLNGVPIKQSPIGMSRSLALMPDSSGFVLGTEWYLRMFDRNAKLLWDKDALGVVWAVNVSQDGRWVVAAYGDGTIRWHRASDGIEQLAFFPHADKKRWVMWTPSGYYDASPGAEELIGWHVNNGKNHAADFFPASRFRDRFNRPDVLAKVLETQDEAEAVRLANEASGRRTQTVTSIAQVLPPVVEIVSPASDSAVQSGKITVRYKVRTAADAPVTAMRVRVNGLLQSDTRALKLVKNNDDTQEIEVTIPEAGIQSATRALKRTGQGQASSSQEVEVQLFAENKFSTSTPAILRLQLAGGKGTTKQTASGKPKLYVLAVGVSKYANPEFNLGLASKDANDFVNSLKGQKGKLYSDVVVKLLTDAQATKDDVLDGLDWLKQNVTANDVGVMFVAGHGMNDKLGGYYFMPHNADPDKLARTGVSQTDIKQTFANLPGHTVFFIDTCYSGGVMGNVRTSGFVNDLASAENGAVVFTASSSGQESLENSTWGNGAFTKSVVEGISGKADPYNDGYVSVKSLDTYVDRRVKMLTSGQQTPVSIAPGGLSDFPIAGVGK